MFCRLFDNGLGNHALNVCIPLVRHDGLRIVIHFPFAVLNMLFNVGQQIAVQVHLPADHFIPLKELDGIPAQIVGSNFALNGFLDMGQGMLYAAIVNMGDFSVGVISGQSHSFFCCFKTAFALQRTDLHTDTAQAAAEFFQIDGVTVLADQIDHIHCHHNRMSQLDELSGQI